MAISSAFFILKGEKPNCTSTACRKSIAETCVWLICAITTSDLDFLQEGFDQGGLAGADLAGDHDEAVGEPDRRLHVRLGAGVLLGQIQELRVRTQSERQLLQFERIEIHACS